MSNNNNNNRSRSSSLPPLRQLPVRASALPSASSPIMEQAGESNVNERISVLEGLIRTLISVLPTEGNVNVAATATTLEEPVEDLTAPTPLPKNELRFVSRRNYNTTSKSVIDTFLANTITIECKDSFVRISMVRGALSTAGLKTMLDGHRIQPISTPFNVNGYRERSVVSKILIDEITGESRTISVLLEEDDMYCYEYDRGRLFQAILEIFHKTLLYLVPTEIEENDGVAVYNKIMEHLNGQRGRDADVAREAFQDYKMNESLTFKQERSKFEEVFKTLEYAQRAKISENDKMQFLSRRIMFDKRIGLRDVIIQSKCNDLSYERTIELLIKVNCEMAEAHQTVKMAGMYPPKNNNAGKSKPANNNDQIKYCYNFNESGECRFGASCIYSHSKDPNHVTREPRAKAIPENKSHPPNQVGKVHRTPNGGEKFKGGYKGKSPRVKFNKASSSEENTSFKTMNVNNETILNQSPSSLRPFESWSNVDQNPFVVAHKSLNNITMKMMRENQLGSNEHEDDFPDNQNAQEIPVNRTSDFVNRSQTIQAVQELQLQHSRRTKGQPLQNLQAVYELDTLQQMMFFRRTFVHLKYPINVECEATTNQGGLTSITSLFTGFNWNPLTSRSGNIVEELRNPTGSLMEMVYRVNENFMGATVVHTTPITPTSEYHAGNFNIAQYSNFRRMGSKEGKPGYYKSTMTSLIGYLTILAKIHSESDTPNLETGNIYFSESTCHLMVWCVVYDFMSFCTYLYGSNYEKYETSIADSRIELVSEIEHHQGTDFRYIGLKDVFLSIARCANGILVDTFVPKMINNHDEDLEDENDLNSDNSDNESDDPDNESNVDVTDPPLQKRQCNRMSIFGQHK